MNKTLALLPIASFALSIMSGCPAQSVNGPKEEAVEPASALSAASRPSSKSAESGSVIDVDASEAGKLVKSKSVQVLDVRTQEEYDRGHVAGAILIDILGNDFENKVAQLTHEKPYVVHCMSGTPGGRSRRAVDALVNSGAKKVYHLDGGMRAWIHKELPVEVAKAVAP